MATELVPGGTVQTDARFAAAVKALVGSYAHPTSSAPMSPADSRNWRTSAAVAGPNFSRGRPSPA